jgi:flagellar motor switch protein FliM
MSDEDPNANVFDALDQSEIDRLLAEEIEEPKQHLILANGKRAEGKELPRVEEYDFRHPIFLSEIELRRLRLIHEDFIRYLSARLSLNLRMDFNLQMSRLSTVPFGKFTDGLPNPSHITLYKVEPLVGVGILQIDSRLALTIVDRLLGGRAHSISTERYLTEIEESLLDDVLQVMIEEWCAVWDDEHELHPHIIGHETNGRFLQTSTSDAILLSLAMEASFGDCSEQIQLGIPFATIEPLVKSMQLRRQRDIAVKSEDTDPRWRPIFESIDMPVIAQWQPFSVPLREVTSLRVGDVLELPPHLVDRVRLSVNGTEKFFGRVGLEDETVTIHLTDPIVKKEEPAYVRG